MQVIWQEVLTHALGFVALVVCLRWLAWTPLLNLLDARRERIAGEFRRIEETKARLEAMQRDYQARLDQIETEARQKIQDAVAEGHRVATEMQEQARAQAAHALDQAREHVQLEIAKAKTELRGHVARLTLETTARLLNEKLDAAKDEQLVLRFLDDVERST